MHGHTILKNAGNFWLNEYLLRSQEVLLSIEVVS
jgi:hypothetical protein